MNVELLQKTDLSILVKAIRTCYESYEKSDSYFIEYAESDYKSYHLGEKDRGLIKSIIESKHESTLEHIVFTFDIKGISRLVLQELARHRIASYSVKSTRYTLKELKFEEPFMTQEGESIKFDIDRVKKYINLIDEVEVNEIDIASIRALEFLRLLVISGKFPNDKLKFAVPECYKTNLIMTINLRSFRNFLNLRLSERAHFEIRELAEKMKSKIPEQYQFLLV
jgi:thymidylate synthase (FAD)